MEKLSCLSGMIDGDGRTVERALRQLTANESKRCKVSRCRRCPHPRCNLQIPRWRDVIYFLSRFRSLSRRFLRRNGVRFLPAILLATSNERKFLVHSIRPRARGEIRSKRLNEWARRKRARTYETFAFRRKYGRTMDGVEMVGERHKNASEI